MDFFDMDFSELFLNKHGKKIFNNITMQIKSESPENYNNNYISIIFKIAFLDYIGLTAEQIENILFKTYKDIQINVHDLLLLHSKSIQQIKKYLHSSAKI